jgi:hypothetical protein
MIGPFVQHLHDECQVFPVHEHFKMQCRQFLAITRQEKSPVDLDLAQIGGIDMGKILNHFCPMVLSPSTTQRWASSPSMLRLFLLPLPLRPQTGSLWPGPRKSALPKLLCLDWPGRIFVCCDLSAGADYSFTCLLRFMCSLLLSVCLCVTDKNWNF